MSTSGPNTCGTGANDNAVGSTAWTNPGNIAGAGTSVISSFSASSNYLKGTNYGFALSSGDNVDGITLITGLYTNSGSATFNHVRIVKGGTIGGTNRSDGSTWPTGSITDVTWGGSTDTWGETWSYSDINASNFGAVIAFTSVGVISANVDYFKMSIDWTTFGDAVFGTMDNPGVAWWLLLLDYVRVTFPLPRREFAFASISREILFKVRGHGWQLKSSKQPTTPAERFILWCGTRAIRFSTGTTTPSKHSGPRPPLVRLGPNVLDVAEAARQGMTSVSI